MSASDWITIVMAVGGLLAGQWAILKSSILNEVEIKISVAIAKLKDDRINELIKQLDDEKHKTEYLKEKIKDLK